MAELEKRRPHNLIVITEEQQDMALGMAEDGKTLTEIKKALGVNSISWRRFCAQNLPFAAELTRAMQEGLEVLADKLLSITEHEPDVNRARLMSDNMKFILSKRKPHVYGDKIELNVNGVVDLNAAILEAHARAGILPRDSGKVIDADSSIISDSRDNITTDHKSVDAPIDPFS